MSLVPTYPPAVIVPGVTNTIRAASPVKGNGQWREMSEAANWLLGKGSVAVCAGPSYRMFDEENNAVLKYYLWPSDKAVARIWFVSLFCPAYVVTGSIDSPDGSEVAFALIPGLRCKVVRVPEVVTDTTPGEVVLQINLETGDDVTVAAVGCYELPRRVLPSVDGVYTPVNETTDSGRPIYDEDVTDSMSVDGVAHSIPQCVIEGRRQKLFDWFNTDGITITATSFPGDSNVFAFNPIVMARGLYDPAKDAIDESREVTWAVLAKMTGSTPSGEVKVTSNASSDNTDTRTFTSSSPTWLTGTFRIKAEDISTLSSDGGIGAGGRDELLIVARKTAGTAIVIYGIAIGELD